MSDINYTKKIKVYSDGGWWRKRGCGGWGYIVRYRNHERQRREYSRIGTASVTTNQRMELIGAIMGLRSLEKPAQVVLLTDSKYLVNGATKWIRMWQERDWLTINREPVKNKELWVEIIRLNAIHNIEWVWVKGHGNCATNNRVDEMIRNLMVETFGE